MPDRSRSKPGLQDKLSTAPRELTGRQFAIALASAICVAAALRSAMIEEFLRENPVSRRPWTDSAVYWEQAGRMADGHWMDETPFLSAPLYPYFLGVLRWTGLEKTGVYVLQTAMHLLTGALLAVATGRRFGRATGLAAGVLFLLLTEPAASSYRLLANGVQVLLATLVWWRWSAVAEGERVRGGGVALAGALIGVFALSYPAAMLLVPVYAGWVFLRAGRGRTGGVLAGVGAAAAAACILPATVHNLIVTRGELIPITAHSGVTLRHGNSPNAVGVLAFIEGVPPGREGLHQGAARVYRQAMGHDGTWKQIDHYFRGQAVRFWLEDVGRTIRLLAAKFWWFFSARNYDDMMPTVLEREYGVGERAILAPLPTALLMGATVAGLMMLARRPLRAAPDLAVFGLALLTVLVFFYSPRYRMPATPVICAASAYALVHWRRTWLPAPVTAGLVLAPLLFAVINAENGFDTPASMKPVYTRLLSLGQTNVGDECFRGGDLAAAQERYRAALKADAQNPRARQRLGELALARGDSQGALAELQKAFAMIPKDPSLLASMYAASLAAEKFGLARRSLIEIVRVQPGNRDAALALCWMWATFADDALRNQAEALRLIEQLRPADASSDARWLDVRAAVLAESGRFEEAVQDALAAENAARGGGDEGLAAAIADRIAAYRAQRPWRGEPMDVPTEMPLGGRQ